MGRAREGELGRESLMWPLGIDFFPILPALLMPEEGLCDVESGRGWADWGVGAVCYIGGATRPVIAGEKKIYKNL